MIQGNRADRQAGLHRRPALPPAPGRLLVRAVRPRARRAARPARGLAHRRRHARRSTSARPTDGSHDHRGVFIPPGVAHGFAALTDMTITYLVDGYYNPADELGVAWDDPAIGADWGVTDPILSDRDQTNPARAELEPGAAAPLRTADLSPCDSSSPAAPASSARTTSTACSRTPTTRSRCSTRSPTPATSTTSRDLEGDPRYSLRARATSPTATR